MRKAEASPAAVARSVEEVARDLDDLARVFDGLLTGNYEPLAGPLRVYGPVHDGNSSSGVRLLLMYLFTSAQGLQKAFTAMPKEKRRQVVEELGLVETVARFRAELAAARERLICVTPEHK